MSVGLLTYGMKIGDTGIALFCERSLDVWGVQGGLVDPKDARKLVAYGSRGRVELTTLTKELFLPRFLERDDAIRRPPCALYAWDGAGEVKPFQEAGQRIIEGVY